MITLLSTLVGFLASVLPSIMKIIEKKQDYGHELQLRKLEIEAAQQGIALQARLQQIQALIEQNRAIYGHDESLSGSPAINNLRASVRPILTYAFFFLFTVIKATVLFAAIFSGIPLEKLVLLVWDEYTASIFGAIIAFWFGSRLWEKTDVLDRVFRPTSTTTNK